MPDRRRDLAAVASGLAIIALGLLLLLDRLDVLAIGLGWLAPLMAAVVGTILLAFGMAERRR